MPKPAQLSLSHVEVGSVQPCPCDISSSVLLWWSHVCLRVTRHSNGGSERAAHAQLLQQPLRQAPRLAAKEHDGKRKGLVHSLGEASRARAPQARASPARAPGAPGWRHAGGNIAIDATCSCPWRPVRWRSQRPPHSLAPPPPSAASAALRLGRHPRAMNPPPPAAQLRPTPCSSDAWRIAPGRPLACFFAVTCDYSSEALHAPRDTGCSVVHDVVEWLRSLSPHGPTEVRFPHWILARCVLIAFIASWAE